VDPKNPEALWSTHLPELVLALLPSQIGRGFMALDASSSIRFITPKAGGLHHIAPMHQKKVRQTVAQGGDNMDIDEEGYGAGEILQSLPGMTDMEVDSENDKPVVRPEQLVDLFEGGHGLPPVKELFNQLVGLYARKPRVAV
jgi:NET1-associated nuclear protein 1 (U3 small nucleolar RNA-associated protein 17)